MEEPEKGPTIWLVGSGVALGAAAMIGGALPFVPVLRAALRGGYWAVDPAEPATLVALALVIIGAGVLVASCAQLARRLDE